MRPKSNQPGALAPQRRVLVLSNYPAPYRQPLFEAVGRTLRACHIDLHVYYAAATESVRDWSVNLTPDWHQVYVGKSKTWGTGVHGFSRFGYDGVGRLARQLQPDLCLVDGFSPGAMKLAMQVPRSRLGMWSGAIGDEPGSMQFLRRLQRRWLVGRSSCAIVLSSAARDYLVALGMPPERISTALNCAAPIETEYVPSVQAQPMRRPMRFLIVGALHPRKGIDLVLNALVRLRESGQSLEQAIEVWIVGSGPARDEIRSQISELELDECCLLLGHLTGNDLQERYAMADMLLFPTRHDIWGLVVNEAMQSGLPVLSSVAAGVTRDLIEDGVTGYSIDFSDTNAVATQLRYALQNPTHIRRMGDRAAKRVSTIASVERSASCWVTAIERALGVPKVTPGQ